MSTRRLFEGILAIAIFAMSVRENIDADLWWHLRTGEAIWGNGRVPQTDIFSYTIPNNVWIVQQWLTDSLMWSVYELVGLSGLIIFFALIVTIAFMLVYSCCEGRPYLASLIIVLAYLSSALILGARPQMINLLFSAMLIVIVEGVRKQRWPEWALFLLPVSALLWANMHSGFLTGIIIMGAYLVGEGSQRFLKKPDELTLAWSAIVKLGIALFLSILAALVNPSGLDLVLFPLGTLSSDAIQNNIVEWFSPDFHSPYWLFFAAMLALGSVSLVFSQRRVTLTDLLLFFGTGWMGLTSIRHIPIFALVASPIIARHLLSAFADTRFYATLAGQYKSEHVSSGLKILNTAVLLVIGLLAVGWLLLRLDNMATIIHTRFPVAAVDYIEENDLDELNVFNAYNWGGYLIWRRIPVFIDGRTELYGNEFFGRYLQTFTVSPEWQQLLDEYDVDYVMVDTISPLSTILEAHTGWQAAYQDDIATIYMKNR